jgi:hypothetical protein
MKKTMIIGVLSVFSLLALQPASATLEYGSLVRGSSSTVYFVTSEHKRLAFMDEQAFLSWYPNFSSVVTIPDAELGTLPFAGVVPLRPGVRPVKGLTDSRVYGIDRNGGLRWLANENVASMIYGNDWNRKLAVVSDTDLATYTRGTDVTGPNQFWWMIERDASPNLQEVNYRKIASIPLAPIKPVSNVTLAVAKPTPTRIIIIPTVINDNGGSGKEGDVEYLINGSLVMPQDGINVQPGASTLYHGQFPGYSASAWSGDCSADGVVNVPANATRVCFITFNDMSDGGIFGSKSNRPPTLALYADVRNENGGDMHSSDVKLFIGSIQVASGFPTSIQAADYTLYNVAPEGYTASLWHGDCTPQGTVALRNGDEKICTITFTN